jgi:hypothetical protein
MSSIYLPANLKARIIRAARRHGFVVERGRQSQLTEFIAYLVQLDEQVGQAAPQQRHTLNKALGLLAKPGQRPPTDAEVDEILDLRRLSQ